MSRFNRRNIRRVLTLVGLTILSALATTSAALAATPDAWMWG